MAKTEAEKRANSRYKIKAYDQVAIRVKKGKREEWKEFAEQHGESLAGMITRLVEQEITKGG